MWSDVVDLFVPNSTAKIDGVTYTGAAGVRQAVERMGPEGLTQVSWRAPDFGSFMSYEIYPSFFVLVSLLAM